MSEPIDLSTYLEEWQAGHPLREATTVAVMALAKACVEISELVRTGALQGALGVPTGKRSGLDQQKHVDVVANEIIVSAMKDTSVATLASEEFETALTMNSGQAVAVAIDPIDGSSNIDANVAIGTIFTVLPVCGAGVDASSFLQRGSRQLAAGFAVYGPFTSLVLTVGQGTHIFALDPATKRFTIIEEDVQIPPIAREYALNVSNYQHWDETTRIYLDDLNKGADGPRGRDFNMRWTASPVSDIYRILRRGGIFLYPGDVRDGYGFGRLRLVYEANPLAWIIEQAGGRASTGRERILNVEPKDLHERTPFVAGSRTEVDYVDRLYRDPHAVGDRSPLFGKRGLFRT